MRDPFRGLASGAPARSQPSTPLPVCTNSLAPVRIDTKVLDDFSDLEAVSHRSSIPLIIRSCRAMYSGPFSASLLVPSIIRVKVSYCFGASSCIFAKMDSRVFRSNSCDSRPIVSNTPRYAGATTSLMSPPFRVARRSACAAVSRNSKKVSLNTVSTSSRAFIKLKFLLTVSLASFAVFSSSSFVRGLPGSFIPKTIARSFAGSPTTPAVCRRRRRPISFSAASTALSFLASPLTRSR